MVKLFERKNGKIKIYYNQEPYEKKHIELNDYKEIGCNTISFSDSYFLGIEVMTHKVRMLYGMVGVSVRPAKEKNVVNIEVKYTTENMYEFENNLMHYKNDVYIGILQEYVEGIYDGIGRALAERNEFPNVDICFSYSANSLVGSSSMHFSYLAELLINMIGDEVVNVIDEMEFTSFCDKYQKILMHL